MGVTTASAAAAELLARRRARESLADYVQYLDLGFAPAAHHPLLIAALEEVERGECPSGSRCPGSPIVCLKAR
jgi:hypothetical protein